MVNKFKTKAQKREFIKCGIFARYYSLIAKIFRSKKYLDKSVECLDKRWDIINSMRHQ